ncbi:hypothetical protein PISMIDRAFT_685595 [Pisolithus microcarpus 441]|uniref:Uncharacterized protein n=1 Tax=Pisolithus microcarpus 441 TaxID=765257 RepID=A0A0C9YKE9_9AGAM|nr:hypothetical protein PISMIDRAFT_685595 [Pisolithus microcarpus 441]
MTLNCAARTKRDKKSASLVVGYHLTLRLSLFPDSLLPANSTASRMRKRMRPYSWDDACRVRQLMSRR